MVVGDGRRRSCGVIGGVTRGRRGLEAEGKCRWKRASEMGGTAVPCGNQEER